MLIKKNRNLVNYKAVSYKNENTNIVDFMLIMELTDFSLSHYIYNFQKDSQLKFNELIGFLWEVSKGIQHLHLHGIVHGNIKPTNLLTKVINGNRAIKVGDF